MKASVEIYDPTSIKWRENYELIRILSTTPPIYQFRFLGENRSDMLQAHNEFNNIWHA